jgi:hypothetical protein
LDAFNRARSHGLIGRSSEKMRLAIADFGVCLNKQDYQMRMKNRKKSYARLFASNNDFSGFSH